jgi:ATP-dependent Clp protease adapter protein ClpS
MSQYPTDRPAVPPTSAEAREQARPQDKPRKRQLPPYRVILLNDNTLDMMFVVRTIMELTRLCRAEATHKMWEAHHSGRSLLLVTHRERAELFVEQFTSKGLSVTLEPG